MRELEHAFKNMDRCMENMNSEYRSTWKYGNHYGNNGNNYGGCSDFQMGHYRGFGNFNGSNFGRYNGGNGGVHEMEFHQTLRNGEFFERWHYMDQRMWKMEQFFKEMAQRMNFSDLEMQMNQWMNNHDSMFRMSSSWMNSNGMSNFGNFGSNNMFSKGLNYDSVGDSSFSNGSTWKVSPPSGPRNNSSRPNFANRYSNYSGGMNSFNFKPGAMYDDGMCGNRFNTYSSGIYGNSFNNLYGSKQNSMNDYGMSGNRFNNYSSGMYGNRFGNYSGGMNGNRFDNYMGNYFDSKPKALYDDGMCGYNPYSSFSPRF
jgi:hypothetical protein